jgi:cation:H+ antiporter
VTNALELALFLPADLLHTEAPILNALDSRAAFLGALGIILTCIYLWGVLERRDRVILGFGIDSALVLFVYAAGLVLLYFAA